MASNLQAAGFKAGRDDLIIHDGRAEPHHAAREPQAFRGLLAWRRWVGSQTLCTGDNGIVDRSDMLAALEQVELFESLGLPNLRRVLVGINPGIMSRSVLRKSLRARSSSG